MFNQGKRIISSRVLLLPTDAEKLFLAVKSLYTFTWKELADFCGVSEYTVCAVWSKGKTTIPLSVFLLLYQLVPHTANPRNQYRYACFIATGVVASAKETETYFNTAPSAILKGPWSSG